MRLRDHALAVFLLLHLGLVGIVSLGNAPNAAGESAVAAAVNAGVDGYNRFRGRVRDVHEVYSACCGVRQGWRMFNAVGAKTARVDVAVRIDGKWKFAYVERSDKHEWNRAAFDHYRWREYFNHLRKKKKDAAWTNFLAWLSVAVVEDFPDADRVRVRVRQTAYPEPAELLEQRRLIYPKQIKASETKVTR